MWGQWGVVSTKGATAYFPVPLIGLRSAWGSPAEQEGKSPAHLRDLVWPWGGGQCRYPLRRL